MLPIGPDFKDKPPATPIPELPPYLNMAATTPPLERTVVLDQILPTTFIIELHDPNLMDSVTVRWILNYPIVTNATRSDAEDTMAPRGDGVFRFSRPYTCPLIKTDFPPADPNILMIASDRPFASPDQAPDPDFRYSYVVEDDGSFALAPVIGSWRISGCQ